MRASTAVTLSCAAVLAAWLILFNNDHKEAKDLVEENPSQARGPADIGPKPREGNGERVLTASPVSSPARETASNELYVEMRKARDLRVFVEAAKRRPEAGGYLYATTALLECGLLRESQLQPASVAGLKQKLAAESGAVARERFAQLEFLEQRCAGFSDSELGLEEWKYGIDVARSRDPLYALRSRAAAAKKDPNIRQQMLSEMLASKDPLLLAQAQSLMWQALPGAQTATYIDGQPFGGLNAEGFMQAWRLATCQVTNTCSLLDSDLAQLCAFEGQCTDSIAAYVRQSAGSPENYDKVVRLANRLTAIIQSGQAGALMPPRS